MEPLLTANALFDWTHPSKEALTCVMVLAVFSQKVMRAFWYRISACENMLHLGGGQIISHFNELITLFTILTNLEAASKSTFCRQSSLYLSNRTLLCFTWPWT